MNNYEQTNVNIPTEGLGDVMHPFLETISNIESRKNLKKVERLEAVKERFKNHLKRRISFSTFATKFPDPGFQGPWS